MLTNLPAKLITLLLINYIFHFEFQLIVRFRVCMEPAQLREIAPAAMDIEGELATKVYLEFQSIHK